MAKSSSSSPAVLIALAGLMVLSMTAGVVVFLTGSAEPEPAHAEIAVAPVMEPAAPPQIAPPVAEPTVIEAPAPSEASDGPITLNSTVRPSPEQGADEAAPLPESTGTIDQNVVRRIVRRHADAMRECYEDALQRKPELAGNIVVGFVISEAGTVSQSQQVRGGLDDDEVEACILETVDSMRFPQPEGGSVTVIYPFDFASE